ncbi:MAG: SMP-30/gluconolactonase/LRE family protein [Acidimicrobiia bacterium]
MIECAVAAGNILGEGPVWDTEAGVLYWLDIKQPRLHRYQPSGGSVRSWDLPNQPGSLAVRERGGLLLALDSGFAFFDPETSELTPLADPEPDRPGNRFNDGKTDRRGRFWAGSMDDEELEWTGALYRFDPDGTWHRLLDGLGIPNTLAWSPGGETMYFAETLEQTIYTFMFDAVAGEISGRRVFATTKEEDCYPDGSTVDAEGFLWNAQFNGWRLVRYAPDGSVNRVVEMPVQNPTSCMFGGEDLDVLYVTSARKGLAEAALEDQPLAGGLFAFDVGVAGLPETPFSG